MKGTPHYKIFFKGKKITVMGLGLLGRGVGDIQFLAKCGAKLTVTDMKSDKELAPSLKTLSKLKGITYVLGKHRMEDFRNADLVLKAAGVHLDNPFIAEAEKNGVPVLMGAALFAKLSGVTTVGVTGTRGKSTVTHLIYHILKTAKKRVHIGGNVRGISTLAQLPNVKRGDIAVLELDSWQLQGFEELKFSPHIAVFTSFLQDHLNYYASMKKYFEDKASIYRNQKKGDVLIAGHSASKEIKKDFKHVHGTFISVTSKDVPANWKRKLIGSHNSENIACAVSAVRALGISEAIIRKAVAHFNPVEGRLQLLRVVRGISVVNDNNGTTPDATIAALNALPKKGRIVLIMGGSDKGISFAGIIKVIIKLRVTIVLLPGTGTERFKKEFKGKYVAVKTMKEAVSVAYKHAKKGDTILLSPSCASFGLFKNEYDRNDQFVEAVKSLI